MTARGVLHRIALCAVVTAAGCGGGSDSPPPVPPPPAPAPAFPTEPPLLPPAPPSVAPAPTSTSPYYLASGGGPLVRHNLALANSAAIFETRHLVVVDPASPTTPHAIEHAGRWLPIAQIDEGVLDSAAVSVSQVSPRFVVYLKEDRRLRLLDLRRGTWPPSPVLLSSFHSNQACFGWAFAEPHLSSPQQSVLLFTGPGPDNQCFNADDQTVVVRLSMSPSDNPITTPGRVVTALRSTVGSITGFVIRDGNRMSQVDENFANPVDLFTIDRSSFDPLLVNQNTLLFIEGGSLRAYNVQTRAGPVSLMMLDPRECCLSSAVADANATYVAVSGVNFEINTGKVGARLLRIAGGAAEVLAVEPVQLIGDIFLTPTRAIYAAGFSYESSFAYRSVVKTGGNPTTLLSLLGCSRPQTVVGGEQLWYGCTTSATLQVSVVRSDGTQPQMFDNTTIVSSARPSSLPLPPADPVNNYSVILARNLSGGPAMLAGAQLIALEASSRTQLVTYGDLPPSSFNRAVGLEGLFQPFVGLAAQSFWGLPSLLGAESTVQSSIPPIARDSDIFFYQSDKAGLTRVTGFVQ